MMRISFLGGGNMATAIITGLLSRHIVAPNRIQVVDINPDQRRFLEQRFGVATYAIPDDDVLDTDLLVIAIKPQVAQAALVPLQGKVDRLALLSIMAGVSVAQIQSWSGAQVVIRAMPNTPALVNAGITALYAPAEAHLAARQYAQQIMQSVGEVVWVEKEILIDAATALSGSGPAYLFLFLEALIEVGQELGLEADVARKLAVVTALGAARLAEASPDSLAMLRKRVTSKGGTTEAALQVLELGSWHKLLQDAVRAAYKRAQELQGACG